MHFHFFVIVSFFLKPYRADYRHLHRGCSLHFLIRVRSPLVGRPPCRISSCACAAGCAVLCGRGCGGWTEQAFSTPTSQDVVRKMQRELNPINSNLAVHAKQKLLASQDPASGCLCRRTDGTKASDSLSFLRSLSDSSIGKSQFFCVLAGAEQIVLFFRGPHVLFLSVESKSYPRAFSNSALLAE